MRGPRELLPVLVDLRKPVGQRQKSDTSPCIRLPIRFNILPNFETVSVQIFDFAFVDIGAVNLHQAIIPAFDDRLTLFVMHDVLGGLELEKKVLLISVPYESSGKAAERLAARQHGSQIVGVRW